MPLDLRLRIARTRKFGIDDDEEEEAAGTGDEEEDEGAAAGGTGEGTGDGKGTGGGSLYKLLIITGGAAGNSESLDFDLNNAAINMIKPAVIAKPCIASIITQTTINIISNVKQPIKNKCVC
jgi:hypothetical protein